MIAVLLYDVFAVAALTYLAVIFGRWWIVLFAVLFIQTYSTKKRYVEDKKDEEG